VSEKEPIFWTVVELAGFKRAALRFWSQDDYDGIILEIAKHAPTGDDLIPNSRGCWKSRKAIGESGKSGGARVIYYINRRKQTIIMLTVYQKSELANIPGNVLAGLVKQLE